MAGLIANLVLDELQRREETRERLRTLRDTSNPFELPEELFRQLYRLDVVSAKDLFEEILPHLSVAGRNTRTPSVVRFCTTLHFLAHGSYQKSVGQDRLNASLQPNVSKSIHEVVNAMNHHLANRYIIFPQEANEIGIVKNGFYEKHHIPGIIGCIDCTHIKLVTPSFFDLGYPANVFMNRKNFYSINCQLICDVNAKILAINCRFPGSVHDAAIWRASNIRDFLHRKFMNGDQATYLIGDSGYPLQPYLLTPIVGAPADTPEGRYTRRHQQIRNCIERTNGILKGIWRCLSSDRVLHYQPAFVSKIICACAILHNFMRTRNIPLDENLIDDNGHNDNDIHNADDDLNDAGLLHRGNIVRNRIIREFFN